MKTEMNSLLSVLADCLQEQLSGYPVAVAYLYGSAASGQMTPLSDVDVALVLAEEAKLSTDRLRFELAMADALSEACGLSEIDVRVINDAPLTVKGEIVTNGVLLYSGDDAARMKFETSVRSEYFDFLPVARAMRRAFFKDIAERGIHGQRAKSGRDAATTCSAISACCVRSLKRSARHF